MYVFYLYLLLHSRIDGKQGDGNPAAENVLILDSADTAEVENENEQVIDDVKTELEGLGFKYLNQNDQQNFNIRDILDSQAQNQNTLFQTKMGENNAESKLSLQVAATRELLQKLCQASLPLGKCIDMVFEDLENLNKEILKWKGQAIKHQKLLQLERQKTKQHLKKYENEMQQIQRQIDEQVLFKSNILRKRRAYLVNEKKLDEILRFRTTIFATNLNQTKT
ncbi:hypothetical protein RFI_02264 [Reticulomyxa filosa]|uniref:TRAF3-interacting protein 1 C-terminal domain-containing protein n=1 Tax=Reticulomyxa filosa TaxID=46433 RepID=X6P8F0_RETFI|nr:hypothetical protein RFI_02264 [Reticulomyxa filosa]|eukprot:ETO34825.1 hypothetical protein RFI_02264 [Reticulomyxa filosa]